MTERTLRRLPSLDLTAFAVGALAFAATMIWWQVHGETMRKIPVLVFLISYLIQYWGPREGVFRILLGLAVLNLAGLMVLRQPGAEAWPQLTIATAMVAISGLIAGLALAVRRWPRRSGWLLLGILVIGVVLWGKEMGDPRLGWVMVPAILQVTLLCGVTGMALIRAPID